MSTQAEFLGNPALIKRRVVLAELRPRQILRGWAATAGRVNVYEIAWSAEWGPAHCRRRRTIEAVREGSTLLSEQVSVADVEATPGSWYWDSAAEMLYLQGAGGDPDAGDTRPNVEWTARFATRADGPDYDGHAWDPRLDLARIPEFAVQGINPLAGASIPTTAGSLRLDNRDGLFDELLYDCGGLGGARLRLLLGSVDLAYSEFRAIFSGQITRTTRSDAELVCELRPMAAVLNGSLPRRVFTAANYPGCREEVLGEQIPLLFGRCEGIRPPLVQSKETDYLIRFSGSSYAVRTNATGIDPLKITGSISMGGVLYEEDLSSTRTLKGRWGGSGSYSWLALVTTDGRLQVYLSSDGTAVYYFQTAAGVVTTRREIEWSAVYNVSTQLGSLVLDGVEVPVETSGTAPAAIFAGTGDFELGSYNGGTSKFLGYMRRPWVAEGVHRSRPQDATALCGYWGGNGLVDLSGRAMHLTQVGGITGESFEDSEGANEVRQAVQLNATDRYYSIADAAQSGLDITGGLTIEAEFEPENITGNQAIAGKRSTGTTNYSLKPNGASDKAYYSGPLVSNGGDFTIEIRFKIIALPSAWRDWIINEWAASKLRWRIRVDLANKLRFGVYDGTDEAVRQSTNAISAATWLKTKLTYKNSDGTQKIWINNAAESGPLWDGPNPGMNYDAGSVFQILGANATEFEIDYIKFSPTCQDNTSDIVDVTHEWNFDDQTLDDSVGGYNLTGSGITSADYNLVSSTKNLGYYFRRSGAALELLLSDDNVSETSYKTGDFLAISEKARARAVFLPSNYVKILLNDSEIFEETGSIPASIYDNSADFLIGATKNAGAAAEFAGGKLCSVAIQNSAILDAGPLKQFIERWRYNSINRGAGDLGVNNLTEQAIDPEDHVYYDGGDVYVVADRQAQGVRAIDRAYYLEGSREIDLDEGTDYEWDAEDCELTVHNPDADTIYIDAQGVSCGDIYSGIAGRADADLATRASDAVLWLLQLAGVEGGQVDMAAAAAARMGDKAVGFYLTSTTSITQLVQRLCLSGCLLDLVVDDQFRLYRWTPSIIGPTSIAGEEFEEFSQPADTARLYGRILAGCAAGTAQADVAEAAELHGITAVKGISTYLLGLSDAQLLADRLALLAARPPLVVKGTVGNLRLYALRPGDALLVTRSAATGPGGTLAAYPLVIERLRQLAAKGESGLEASDWRGAGPRTAKVVATGYPDYGAAGTVERHVGGFVDNGIASAAEGQCLF